MKRRPLVIILIFWLPACALCQNRDINYFIDHSVTSSPQLLEYRNLLLANSIDSQLVIAANRFQLTGVGNTYYAPIINGYGYDEAITNGQQLSALVALNRQIYNKRNLSLQFNNLKLQRDSITTTASITAQDIRKNIVTQYITVFGDQLQLDFNNEIIALLSNEEFILKKLTQKNVYKQVDYLSFLVTLQQQQLTRSQLIVQLKNDYATLNYLAGIVDTTTSRLAEPKLEWLKEFVKDNSPFLFKYKIDSLRLVNEKNMVSLGYRPRVNVFADAGLQTTFYNPPYKNFGASVGINLSIPIYDGRQKQLQFSKIDIQERTRQRQKDFFTTQYQQQVQQLEQQLELLDGLAEPINKQIEYIKTLIEVNGKLLETGDVKITDYVLALNNYITSLNLVVQNKVARYQVINQLNYWNLKQ